MNDITIPRMEDGQGWEVELPPVMRLLHIHNREQEDGSIGNQAWLWCVEQMIGVQWRSEQPDPGLAPNVLVAVEEPAIALPPGSRFRVHGLTVAAEASHTVNLFHTVPREWVGDRRLVARAASLWDCLPRNLAGLVNEILWDGGRFHCYLMVPRQAGRTQAANENFRHTVEVAERAAAIAGTECPDSVPLVIAGALLHDAGKAEALYFDPVTMGYQFSSSGIYLGPRVLGVSWLGAAYGRVMDPPDDATYVTLLNMLRTVPDGSARLAAGVPVMPEASVLARAHGAESERSPANIQRRSTGNDNSGRVE